MTLICFWNASMQYPRSNLKLLHGSLADRDFLANKVNATVCLLGNKTLNFFHLIAM